MRLAWPPRKRVLALPLGIESRGLYRPRMVRGEPKGTGTMQQQMAVITLGSTDLGRAKRFYLNGFGWKPVFENPEIVFYQMNGFVLGLFLKSALEADMGRSGLVGPGAYALAHNVRSQEEVEPAIQQLLAAGGTLLRPADAPPHGGYRGYVADPDDHAWEIAWNPAWPISPEGYVTFE